MQFHWYIVSGISVITAETLALVALLLHGRRRKAAERSLEQRLQQDRRESECLAREVSRRLITAQENERKRIARDLHDDLNQRLAMLSVELELLRQKMAEAAHTHVDEIGHRVKELASDVHRLSFQLHPAKLEELGLVTAARTLCRDVSQQSGVQIQFTHNEIRRDLDPTLALCLYRVLQESLQNVVRHSGASEVRVNLTAGPSEIRLLVTDCGRGFDPLRVILGEGLGFVSMRERMRQVNGTFTVSASPGSGTTLEVCAPIVLTSPAEN